jgi:tRNA-specific adenosine deaminase 2
MSIAVSADNDIVFMQHAVEEAERALEGSEVPVGCVIVTSTGEIIARGSNKTNVMCNGTQHAEIVALTHLFLEDKVAAEILESCTLYVTCEPCIMCAAALSRARIGRVVFGCFNDRFGGNGSILSIHCDESVPGRKYPIQSGILKEKAIGVFQRFYDSENRRAPEPKRRKKESKEC